MLWQIVKTKIKSCTAYLYASLVIHIHGWVQQKRQQGDALTVQNVTKMTAKSFLHLPASKQNYVCIQIWD